MLVKFAPTNILTELKENKKNRVTNVNDFMWFIVKIDFCLVLNNTRAPKI